MRGAEPDDPAGHAGVPAHCLTAPQATCPRLQSDFCTNALICGKSRRGDFQIRRKSRRDRMRAKLREIKEGLRQRWHVPIPETGKWLGQIVAGYFAYHAVPTNYAAIGAFHYHVSVLWHRRLCRRSQKARLVWPRMAKLVDDFLPKPRILHPWPSVRFAVRHPR